MGVGDFLSKSELSFIKEGDGTRMLPDLDSLKSPFVSLAGSVIDGFDDLSTSVKKSGMYFAIGLASAGLFIGCGIVVSTVLGAYLQQQEVFVPKHKKSRPSHDDNRTARR
ncbi:hypothetical protein PTSG_05840 [Salpingoeca rosetta]|uniref:Uncharacterized protein n=1 Tax=Salpingoeca rosetta (strain ATCC 50818 / BSB-021) TaxID=946362 RepID=F2UCY1_SALR5|nr:uncharacterized protein PTSG_05840 [Salpingoeca rosetta]EGD74476.1 hypothetical protein PTSG_05840 [Salpingoeca rosetta]|eukprot:XP_004992733.1 hypothetical protein PTSG_05840 [Salpingoeca rosetta]